MLIDSVNTLTGGRGREKVAARGTGEAPGL